MDDRYGPAAHLTSHISNTSTPPGYGLPPTAGDGTKQEIGDILQQIMTITDQSLDEAQTRYILNSIIYSISIFGIVTNIYKIIYNNSTFYNKKLLN